MIQRVLFAAWLLAACSFGNAAFAEDAPAAKPPVKFNWTAWKAIPVLDGGRIKPMDTFAREHVEAICGRMSPTLNVHGVNRKFDPNELVFLWLTQPADWSDVAFLRCDDGELRKALKLELLDAEGEKLKYISLDQLNKVRPELASILEEARRKMDAAEKEIRAAEVTSMDRTADELFSAFNVYQSLLVNPYLPSEDESELLVVGPAQTKAAESLERFKESLAKLAKVMEEKPGAFEFLNILSADMLGNAQKVVTFLGSRRQFPPTLAETDDALAALEASLKSLSEQCTSVAGKIDQPLPPQLGGNDPETRAKLETAFRQFAESAPQLKPIFEEMIATIHRTRFILLDGTRAPRIVPGLNPASYELDESTRRQFGQSAPWVDLQAILYAPKASLENYGYNFTDVETIRTRYKNAVAKYEAGDVEGFTQATNDFASAVRYLAQQTEPKIKNLPVKELDEGAVAAVAYPSRESLGTELLYNRTDPFFQTWIVSFLAGVSFALAFGWARKPMIWVGFLLLLLSIGVSIFGFTLRVSITKWAPVTNMYETVIYVSTVVAILGAWFLMLPVTWRGFNIAWRLTALPGTPEAAEPTDEQAEVISPEAIHKASLALLLPRVLLAAGVVYILSIAPYSAGGEHIINLQPNIDYGATMPNSNQLTVWLVGLCVLSAAVWWVPRTALSLAASVVTIPLAVARSKKPVLEKVYEFPRPVFGMAAAFVACLGALVAWYAPTEVLNPNFKPLQPVLRDNFWLTIHVLTIVSSYAAGALAWGLGNIALGCYLFGRYRTSEVDGDVVVRAPEVCSALAGYVYKVIQVAVLLLAAGTILGGLWADVSWGRFWGWDPKEVWALASLLVYLAILHGRYAGWFNNFGLAVGSVLGASAIAMSWYGVNFYLGAGLHSYGFGTGGQMEVFSVLMANWIFMAAAATRYSFATAADSARKRSDDAEGEDDSAPADLAAGHRA